jgi:hypothetical protein
LRWKSKVGEESPQIWGWRFPREGEERQKFPRHGRGPERVNLRSCVYKGFYLVFLGGRVTTFWGQILQVPWYSFLIGGSPFFFF